MKPGEHRETARVLLSNPAGEVFLLLTHFDPEVGLPPRWLTPGGGIERGETPRDAAIRELFEETGLIVEAEALGEPIWETSGRWDWPDGNHHTFRDIIFQLKVEGFQLDDSGWTVEEHRDVLQYRWWNVADLATSAELVSPPGLIEFLAEGQAD